MGIRKGVVTRGQECGYQGTGVWLPGGVSVVTRGCECGYQGTGVWLPGDGGYQCINNKTG